MHVVIKSFDCIYIYIKIYSITFYPIYYGQKYGLDDGIS